jgi:Fe-S-cluster containining protein
MTFPNKQLAHVPYMRQYSDIAVDGLILEAQKIGAVVSCRKACSACCSQSQITITLAEAKHLSSVSGRPLAVRLKTQKQNELKGVPCTFLDLKTQECSIYSERPWVCRVSVSFDDPAKCKTEELRIMLEASQVAIVSYKMFKMNDDQLAQRFYDSPDESQSDDIRNYF